MLIQWGYITSQASNVQNYFHTSFPTKCVSMFICSIRTSSTDSGYDYVNSVTQNGFKCLVSNVPFYWLAIGF